jgi:hypothetical protein
LQSVNVYCTTSNTGSNFNSTGTFLLTNTTNSNPDGNMHRYCASLLLSLSLFLACTLPVTAIMTKSWSAVL